MNKNRFLIISSFTLPEHSGSGIHALRFAQFLVSRNIKTKLLTYNRNLRFKRKEVLNEVLIERIPYFNNSILLKVVSLPLVYFFFLKNIVKIDVILIYGNKIAGFNGLLLLGKLFRKKVVFRSTLIGVDDFETIFNNSKLLQKIYKIIFNSINTYFSINKEFSKRFKGSDINNVSLFESAQGVNTKYFNFVDPAERNCIRKKLNLEQKKYIIISPGLLIKRKGFDELFYALSKLNLDFLLLVVGSNEVDGSHFLAKKKKEIEELKSLGHNLLGNKINFINHSDDMHEYLQASDLFVLNSKAEGVPNVLLEAMSIGLPIVIRKIIGIDNYITFNNKNCLEFEFSDDISKHISALYTNSDKAKQLGIEAKRLVKDKFSFEVVTRNLLNHLFPDTIHE